MISPLACFAPLLRHDYATMAFFVKRLRHNAIATLPWPLLPADMIYATPRLPRHADCRRHAHCAGHCRCQLFSPMFAMLFYYAADIAATPPDAAASYIAAATRHATLLSCHYVTAIRCAMLLR